MNTQESAVPSVFFTAPFAEHDRVLEKSLTRAVSEVGAILRYPGDSFGTVGAFLDDIRNSSVVVCDVSSRNPNVMLELGFAEALKKPIILLSKTSHDAPFDITNRRYLIYGSFESEETLKLVLIQLLQSALAENTAPAERPRTKRGPRIFVSYAHQDKAFLDRLDDPPTTFAKTGCDRCVGGHQNFARQEMEGRDKQ